MQNVKSQFEIVKQNADKCASSRFVPISSAFVPKFTYMQSSVIVAVIAMHKDKVFSGIALGCVLILSVLSMQAGAGGVAGTPAPAGYGETKNMTFYFHNETVANYIFDYSTTYIFNTILGSKMESIGRWGSVVLDFYLSPQLASNITICGDVTVVFYLNMSATSNNFNGNLGLWLYDVSYVSPGGVETSVEIGNAQKALVLTTNIAAYAVTIPSVNYTVEQNHSLRARVSVSGGASNYYFMWFGTGNWDSMIILPMRESIHVESIGTYDYLGNPTFSFDPMATNTTIVVRTNITDPFGGYDIYWVNLTVMNSSGAVLPELNNVSMLRISGNNRSFISVYQYEFNYSGLMPGKYTILVWALDLNGYYWYTHMQQFEYGPYPDTNTTYFYIGRFPVYANFKCVDAGNNSLIGAVVEARIGNVTVGMNFTDAHGLANLTLSPGNYTIAVLWQDVRVAGEVVSIQDNISEENAIIIQCAVYRAGFRTIDSDGEILGNALLYITHPNGTIFELKTDEHGIAANVSILQQLPGGNYMVKVQWRGIYVGQAIIALTHNAPPYYTISCAVYTITFIAEDSRGAPLSDCNIVVYDNATGFIMNYGYTNASGMCVLKLPNITADVQVYWHSVMVHHGYYNIAGSGNIHLNCSVYYLTVYVSDSEGKNIVGASVRVYGSTLVDANVTDENGKCVFRLPAGNYTLIVDYRDTIMLAKIDMHTSDTINLSADTTHRIVFPATPFYATPLFAFSAIIAVLIAVILVLLASILRKRKAEGNKH